MVRGALVQTSAKKTIYKTAEPNHHMLRILSTMERLVEVMMRSEFGDLGQEIQAEILELLSDNDRSVLNMSAVNRESNQQLRGHKQKIMGKVQIIKWLRDQQAEFHEIADDDGTQYKIQTNRTAIRNMPSWKVLVRDADDISLRHGYIFYRSSQWILCLTKGPRNKKIEMNIHRIQSIAELKQKLFHDETSEESYTQTTRGRGNIHTEITPGMTPWMQERIRDTDLQPGKLNLYKDTGCNWEFQLEFEEENYPRVDAIILPKEEDSKMGIWYEITLRHDGNGQWSLDGYIQDIDQDRIEKIETWPYDIWKNSLYYAENRQRPELQWM